MSNVEFCAQKGHCRHEPDGSQHARHAGRQQDVVRTVCCDCGNVAILPMHSRDTLASLGPQTRKIHGRFKPVIPGAA